LIENYKYQTNAGLSGYCKPNIMNTVSGFFKLQKIIYHTF